MRSQHVRPTAHEALACLKAMLRYFQEYPPSELSSNYGINEIIIVKELFEK
jgi:hypothetical protein